MIELVAALDTKVEPKTTLAKPEEKYTTKSEEISKQDIINITGEIFKEIASLKTLFWHLSDKITYSFITELSPDLQELAKLMLKNGFTSDFILSFLQQFKEVNLGNFDELRNASIVKLSENLVYSNGVEGLEKALKILFVGPTGSGKSLTAIKLGLLFKLLYNAKVGVISCDNQKVGGWEQMQMLSGIANLPSTFVQSNDDFLEILSAHKNFDYVLVDTSGINPRDDSQLEEIQSIRNTTNFDYVFLVLSVTSSRLNFSETAKLFTQIHPTHLILTKFDEVATIGHIYESIQEYSQRAPLIYFTNGMNIPNAIEPANKDFISKFLVNYLT
jgi:flagellar biosynthesis GTPase FlhF